MLIYVLILLSVKCKVQDDAVTDRVLLASEVFLSLPVLQPPGPQNVRCQSHSVIDNEGDVQMPLWESKSFHPVRINTAVSGSNDTGEASSGCKCLCFN
jgi:hypothetical protein